MSEQTQTNIEQDPLSAAAGNLEEPKFPVLAPDQVCEFKVSSSKVGVTKDTADAPESEQRKSLTVTVKTTKDYRDADGKSLRAGFPVYLRYGITPTEGTEDKRARTNKQIAEELGMVLKGIGMASKSPRDLINDPAMIEGGIFQAKVSISKGKDGYGDSNRLSIKLPA